MKDEEMLFNDDEFMEKSNLDSLFPHAYQCTVDLKWEASTHCRCQNIELDTRLRMPDARLNILAE